MKVGLDNYRYFHFNRFPESGAPLVSKLPKRIDLFYWTLYFVRV